MTSNLLNFDPPSQTLTMSSRDIADLLEARPDNVRRTIERLAERGVITLPPLEEKATGGRPTVEYVFSGEQGKRDSIVVVAQISPEFTARLVDRWQELEAQISKPFPIPRTLTEALRLAADLEEQRAALAIENEAKAKVIAHQMPHVAHSQALLATDEVLSMGEMAKKINQAGYPMGQNRLYTTLVDDGVLMKDKMPYQHYAHWFFIETDVWIDGNNKRHAKHSLRVTAKGEAALLKKYAPKSKPIERKSNPPTTGLFKPRRVED